MAEIILSNKAQCRLCRDVIESVHAHDFKYCTCKTIAVDGGLEYIKRLYQDPTDKIELSEIVKGGEIENK